MCLTLRFLPIKLFFWSLPISPYGERERETICLVRLCELVLLLCLLLWAGWWREYFFLLEKKREKERIIVYGERERFNLFLLVYLFRKLSLYTGMYLSLTVSSRDSYGSYILFLYYSFRTDPKKIKGKEVVRSNHQLTKHKIGKGKRKKSNIKKSGGQKWEFFYFKQAFYFFLPWFRAFSGFCSVLYFFFCTFFLVHFWFWFDTDCSL